MIFKPSPISEYLNESHLGSDYNYFMRNALLYKYLCHCFHKFLAVEFLSQGYAHFDGFLLHVAKLLSRKVKWIYIPINHCQIPYPKSFYNFFLQKWLNRKGKKKLSELLSLGKHRTYKQCLVSHPSILLSAARKMSPGGGSTAVRSYQASCSRSATCLLG